MIINSCAMWSVQLWSWPYQSKLIIPNGKWSINIIVYITKEKLSRIIINDNKLQQKHLWKTHLVIYDTWCGSKYVNRKKASN